MKQLLFAVLILFCSASLFANEGLKITLAGKVISEEDGHGVSYATVEVEGENGTKIIKVSDEQGEFSFTVLKAKYKVRVSSVGYKREERVALLTKNDYLTIRLKTSSIKVGDVTVTASEKRGMTATSVINRKAMDHIQPSSIADLMELLPGGSFKYPTMGKANFVQLRQAGSMGADYDISSFGTSFVIDGVPFSTDANLQSIKNGVVANDNRDITSKGVDMRMISTDNIESVEVIRGIPSVQYGDLTSGVVKINRKEGKTNFEARFKADQFSKLMSAGKGFGNDNNTVNVSLDYLDSKVDPRDKFENYKRLTASARYYHKKYYTQSRLEFRSALDYTGSFDNKKADPDLDELNDKYSSSFNRSSFNNSVKWQSETDSFLRSLELKTSISMQFDKLKQTRDVYLNTPSYVPNSFTEGEHDGLFLPNNYLSDLVIDGKPLSGFAMLNAHFAFETFDVQHRVNIGVEYRIDKNLGAGQVYDPTRPPSPSMRGRARAYKEIAALQKVSAFIEDKFSYDFSRHSVELLAGVRTTMMVGMNKRYVLSNKLYVDPRVNLAWKLPSLSVQGNVMEIMLGAGYGVHSKMPSIAHLYPEKNYYDLESLNYYHDNADYRRLYLTTFIVDPTNFNLKATRNRKWEIRGDVSYAGNNLSVTYFREKSNSGFRDVANYLSMSYKKYDASGVDHTTITESPDPLQLPYSNETLLTTYSRTENGSTLNKEGIEFQFTTKRFPIVNTRVTVNGAWFRTLYTDSYDMLYSNNIILDGKRLPYIGIYDLNDGARKEQFNTNLMLDTYLPKLGLTFSTSVQSMWYIRSSTFPRNGVPTAYIDANGDTHPYTEESRKDALLQWLVLKETSVNKSKIPIAVIVNFKANKQFGKHLNLSLFVSQLLDYMPDYELNGIVNHRSVSPYFGMELNIKL